MEIVIETPNSPRKRKGTNWEKWGWMYMRISGAVLVAMIFGHLLVNMVLPEGGVKAIDFAFVAMKWSNPFWQFYDCLMLWLAVIHGSNGMRTIVNDYAERDAVRKTLNILLLITAVGIIVLGTVALTTFDPCIDPAAHNYLPAVCK
ncbi:MAG: succinate dehydrogenase hydrophobic membrane anchor subunit [Micrococcales bacterium]